MVQLVNITEPAKPLVSSGWRGDGPAAPGLRDVARAAGVSTASASRALTRPERVSEALRERVLYAASTLGYIANSAARSLSLRRFGLVGVMMQGLGDPVEAETLRAAEARLSAAGIGLVIGLVGEQAVADASAQALASRGVDGMLFIGVGIRPELARWCSDRGLPYASAGQPIAGGLVPAAGGSLWRRGQDLAQRYLRELGHERIGVVTGGEIDTVGPALEQRDAAATIEQGAARLDDADSVRAAVAMLLQREVTAIVAMADMAAVAALRECRARALAVPQQISIVGWGDTGLARCSSPTLTSMRVPASQLGEDAAEGLLALLAGSEYTWPDRAVKLVIRESSGAARR